MKSFGSYGVVSAKSVVGEDAALIEELLFRGFVVLPDVIDRVQVDELCCRLDAVYARQCDEIGGEENLALINDLDIVRCPLAYDESFLDMAANAKFIRLVKSLLGDNIVLLMQNGVINRPDRIQFQTNWHRDLNYQHWVCSKPIAVSALVCLEDFDQETGGTVFLSGSHKFEQFPSPPFAERAAETPNVPRGSWRSRSISPQCLTGNRRQIRGSRAISGIDGRRRRTCGAGAWARSRRPRAKWRGRNTLPERQNGRAQRRQPDGKYGKPALISL
jgi:hypothetical protein